MPSSMSAVPHEQRKERKHRKRQLLRCFRQGIASAMAGDQADVLLWRLIGIFHLLLANMTQNLQVCVKCEPYWQQ